MAPLGGVEHPGPQHGACCAGQTLLEQPEAQSSCQHQTAALSQHGAAEEGQAACGGSHQREDLGAGLLPHHPQAAVGTGLGEVVLQHRQGGNLLGAAAEHPEAAEEGEEDGGGDEQWEAALHPEPGSASGSVSPQ